MHTHVSWHWKWPVGEGEESRWRTTEDGFRSSNAPGLLLCLANLLNVVAHKQGVRLLLPHCIVSALISRLSVCVWVCMSSKPTLSHLGGQSCKSSRNVINRTAEQHPTRETHASPRSHRQDMHARHAQTGQSTCQREERKNNKATTRTHHSYTHASNNNESTRPPPPPCIKQTYIHRCKPHEEERETYKKLSLTSQKRREEATDETQDERV
jgi:hypothetical protein